MHKHTGVNPFQPSLARDLRRTGCCLSNLMWYPREWWDSSGHLHLSWWVKSSFFFFFSCWQEWAVDLTPLQIVPICEVRHWEWGVINMPEHCVCYHVLWNQVCVRIGHLTDSYSKLTGVAFLIRKLGVSTLKTKVKNEMHRVSRGLSFNKMLTSKLINIISDVRWLASFVSYCWIANFIIKICLLPGHFDPTCIPWRHAPHSASLWLS